MSRTAVIVQARTGSSRLPGKVLAEIEGTPLLALVLHAASRIPGVDEVILATTTNEADRKLLELARRVGATGFAGSENDVLDRFYRAAKKSATDKVIRVTADCPLLDPWVSGAVLETFNAGGVDYVSNCHPCTYPDGLDTEVFSFAALERAWDEAALPSEREHVTPYLWKHPELFRQKSVTHLENLSEFRWTVDEPDDLKFVRSICARLAPAAPPYRMEQVLQLVRAAPELSRINAGHIRNAGYLHSLEQETKTGERIS